jgi:hypothetical protein
MSDILRDYFLNLPQLSMKQLGELRQRYVSLLNTNWPLLDTRPNSVAGDLIVTPTSVMTAVAENAMFMIMSDMDLGNTAAGITYNPAFVQSLMANLGVLPLSATVSTGVIALTFNANKNYVIDANTQFTTNSSVFQFNASAGSPVVIYASDASNPSSASNKWVLTNIGNGQFVVYLPVTGPAGAVVSDGTSFITTLTQPNLVSAASAGDFDAGSASETIQQMAVRAQSVFAAANLNTRSGIISFLTQRWPNLLNNYAILTGDPEMTRAGTTPLGVTDGAADVFVKSLQQYASGSSVVTLTYDATQGGWIGAITAPTPIAFFDLSKGIFQTNNFLNNQGKNVIYSSSVHPTADDTSIAFSKYERLGIFIQDTNPTNFQAGWVSAISETRGTGASLSVTGEYASSHFNNDPRRDVTLRCLSATTLRQLMPTTLNPAAYIDVEALQCNVIDNTTGENDLIYFVPNATSNPTGGVLDKTTLGYARMLRGLDLDISTPSQTFNSVDYIGSTFNFTFQGRTANFSVNYLYEPALISVDSTIQDPNNRPIGVDVVTRSYLPCLISQFNISYRIGFGNVFDEAGARQDIFNYLSALSYPDSYDDAQIGQILLNRGAGGLIGITKRGVYMPSLASQFVDKLNNMTPVPRFVTTTLQPPINDLGVSGRNTTFILSAGTIQFNSTVS